MTRKKKDEWDVPEIKTKKVNDDEDIELEFGVKSSLAIGLIIGILLTLGTQYAIDIYFDNEIELIEPVIEETNLFEEKQEPKWNDTIKVISGFHQGTTGVLYDEVILFSGRYYFANLDNGESVLLYRNEFDIIEKPKIIPLPKEIPFPEEIKIGDYVSTHTPWEDICGRVYNIEDNFNGHRLMYITTNGKDKHMYSGYWLRKEEICYE